MVGEQRFTPYGTRVAIDSAPAYPLPSYGWTGREYDGETGFYYLRARYYDPVEDRFTQADPIGYRGGDNLYAYVSGRVLSATDPSGEDVCYIEHHLTYLEYGNSGVIKPGSIGGYDKYVCEPDHEGPDGMAPISNPGGGGPGGSSSSGPSSSSSSSAASSTPNPRCSGVQVSLSVSAEAGGPTGFFGALFAGVSISVNLDLANGQFSVSISSSYAAGGGVYAGAGVAGGASYTPDAYLPPWSFTPSSDQEAIINFGVGEGGGIVLSKDDDGGYGASRDAGEVGMGIGVEVAQGGADRVTFAFPTLWGNRTCQTRQ